MRINDLRKVPEFLYHATTRDRLNMIHQDGLVPGNISNHEDSDPTAIYLADTPELARKWGSVVLKINTTSLDPNLFEPDRILQHFPKLAGHHFQYHGPIPTSAISNFRKPLD